LLQACELRGRNRDFAIGSVRVLAALRCLYNKGPGGGSSSSGFETKPEAGQPAAAAVVSAGKEGAGNDPLALAGRWRLCLTARETGELTFWSDQQATVPPTFREYAPPLARAALPLPWTAPQLTLPLPFGLRAEGRAALSGDGGGWPNAAWELRLEPFTNLAADAFTAQGNSGGSGFTAGRLALPFPPAMPTPVTVLALDAQLMVTAELQMGKGARASRAGIPACEVWIRDDGQI
jgi:hypothetical protein